MIGGQYYTEIDGETYLVIELGKDAVECDTSVVPYAHGWENGAEIDISDGSYYTGTISEANNCIPIIKGNPEKDYVIKASNLWGINKYKFKIYYFNSAFNNWFMENKTFIFVSIIGGSKDHVLFTGTANALTAKIRLECCLDESSGTIPFTYRVFQESGLQH